MEQDPQTLFKEALRFAAEKHISQKENGSDLPYLVHLIAVASEVAVACQHEASLDQRLATTIALLHDVLEDTNCTDGEIEAKFGTKVLNGVQALTKSKSIQDKYERLIDSIARIRQMPPEVAVVKLADRISNLDAPNLPWPEEKRRKYMEGSNLILLHLGGASDFLSNRLKIKIKQYVDYVVTGE